MIKFQNDRKMVISAAMVQSVIPMSGPPNLIGHPQYTNLDAPGLIDLLCFESDVACPGGLNLQGKIDHLRSIENLSSVKTIYAWMLHNRNFGAMKGNFKNLKTYKNSIFRAEILKL